MEKLPNMHALCDFLGKEPDSLQLTHYTGMQSAFFDPKYEKLRDALELYDRPAPTHTSKGSYSGSSEFPEIDSLLKENERSSYLGDGKRIVQLGDTLLFDLTRMAAGVSRKAGYACYILGCFYDDWQLSAHTADDTSLSYLKAAYFYGKALQKGYVTDDSQKAYADACAHLGWFDTALYWYPKYRGQEQLAHIYLSHRVRYCQERGAIFPKTKNHIVCMGENPRAKELEAMLSGMYRSEGSVRSKLSALEHKVSPKVKEFCGLLDRKEEQLLKRRKWSRRKWWLFYLILTACAAPGFLNGNGEGLQGLSYQLFIATYAPFGNTFLEGLNFAQRLASNLDDAARTTMAGAGLAFHGIATMFWTLFLRFFVKKKHSSVYGKLKRQLYEDAKLDPIMEEIEQIGGSDKAVLPEGFKNPNALAAAWHDAVVANAPQFTVPYGDIEEHRQPSHSTGGQLLYDYDAFVSILEKIFEKSNRHVLFWYGHEVASAYADASGLYQSSFLNYCTKMLESAANAPGHNSRQAQKQLSILEKKIRDMQRPSSYGTVKPKSEPSESLGKIIGDELNKAGNLFAFGVEATNEEIIDALERSGKISSTEADKARFSPWGLQSLEPDDDDPYT